MSDLSSRPNTAEPATVATVELSDLTENQRTALSLQRSLLPTVLGVDGLDIAARYQPAAGNLGGDWYDVFRLPGDRIGFVMGDVVGHGLASAIVMGRLRSALRAYALEHERPAHVLDLLDRKIFHFERGALATVLFGVSAAPYDRVTFSSAGHPAPLIVAAGEAAHQVDLHHDLMLGVQPGTQRHERTVELPRGAAFCMFTDGLIERRPPPEPWDDDQLAEGTRALVGCFTAADAERSCDTIMGTVLPTSWVEDDVAVLVVRRSDTAGR